MENISETKYKIWHNKIKKIVKNYFIKNYNQKIKSILTYGNNK